MIVGDSTRMYAEEKKAKGSKKLLLKLFVFRFLKRVAHFENFAASSPSLYSYVAIKTVECKIV